MFTRSKLSNGIRLVTEKHSHAKAVAASVAVSVGSRDEAEYIKGACHFLEHLVFKGTRKRNPYQIVHALESVGGDINAYTTKDITCFHTYSLKEHLARSIDVIADLAQNAVLRSEDFELERDVILQEMAMVKDSSEEYIYDVFFKHYFKKHPLATPIIGSEKTLSQIQPEDIREFYHSMYTPDKMTICVVGDVEHKEVEALCEKYFHVKSSKAHKVRRTMPKPTAFYKNKHKDSEQLHMLLGFPIAMQKEGVFYEAAIINAYLGGGMTSRLYQDLREEKGLCYSVYSAMQLSYDYSLLNIYTGTSPEQAEQSLKIILKELSRLKKQGMSAKMLKEYQEQLRASIILGSDDIEGRMSFILYDEILSRPYRSLLDVEKSILKVSTKSIKKYLNDYFDFSKLGVCCIGPLNEKQNAKLEKLWKDFIQKESK